MKKLPYILIILISVLTNACATIKNTEYPMAKHDPRKEFANDVYYPLDVYDPLFDFNIRSYYLNYQIDKYFLLPIKRTYKFITPQFAQKGISNFFSNLGEINNFANSLLQLKIKRAVKSVARFGINSTFGILGTIDVASKMELPKTTEDFGQTLAFYGVPDGAYLVLPVLGPSNLRDSLGKIVDTITFNQIDPLQLNKYNERQIPYYSLNVINSRADVDFSYYSTASPFEYEYIRFMYFVKRKLETEK